jgi:hypothetical protein
MRARSPVACVDADRGEDGGLERGAAGDELDAAAGGVKADLAAPESAFCAGRGVTSSTAGRSQPPPYLPFFVRAEFGSPPTSPVGPSTRSTRAHGSSVGLVSTERRDRTPLAEANGPRRNGIDVLLAQLDSRHCWGCWPATRLDP